MLFRLFIENPEKTVKIIDEQFDYLTKVLRLKNNAKFEVVQGTTEVKVYRINIISKKYLTAEFLEQYTENNEPDKKLTLVQPLLKSDKLELVIQKCTEIGVHGFYLYEAEQSPVRLKGLETKLPRWERIIESAVCQSRRSYKPEIKVFSGLAEALQHNSGQILYADQDPAGKNIDELELEKDLWVVVGSESGFSEREKQLLIGRGQVIKLGLATLRTETASMALSAKILI